MGGATVLSLDRALRRPEPLSAGRSRRLRLGARENSHTPGASPKSCRTHHSIRGGAGSSSSTRGFIDAPGRVRSRRGGFLARVVLERRRLRVLSAVGPRGRVLGRRCGGAWGGFPGRFTRVRRRPRFGDVQDPGWVAHQSRSFPCRWRYDLNSMNWGSLSSSGFAVRIATRDGFSSLGGHGSSPIIK